MKLLRMRQLAEKVSISKSKLYEMVSNGEFPQPVLRRGRDVFWDDAEADQWIEQQVTTYQQQQQRIAL